MDFIEQLPQSNGYDSILVIVDRASKQGIFIPCHNNITSEQLARLFLIYVFSKHGVPGHITSDRGSEFVSQFFQALAKALDMKLHFTSGYHPSADGQTERTNQTLEQYIRIYCSYQQDDWETLLPLAEFAYNNAPNVSTGISPFFANKGYHPNITIHRERDLASIRARDMIVNLDDLNQVLKSEIALAQERYKIHADERRLEPPDFKVGEKVLVSAKHIRTTRPTDKFSELFLGPYEIVDHPSRNAFTLHLPTHMRSIHPTFHVSQLERIPENPIPGRVQSPPPPIIIDGDQTFEIYPILDSKYDRRRRDCQLLYYVRYIGYVGAVDEYDWLPATELEAPEHVEDFHQKYPNKAGPELLCREWEQRSGSKWVGTR